MAAPAHGSLTAFLAAVPDHRDAAGRRHPLAAMLAHACCAILCGCRGYSAIVQWGRDQPIELMHKLGYTRTPPGFGTFQDLFVRLDVAALERALARWVDHRLGPRAADALRAVAIDGKVLRGSLAPLAPAVHLLAALDQATGCVLGQSRVDAATNEHKAALALLESLALGGQVVTGDAMFCQRDLSTRVRAAGGHYLWKVDDNQPALKEAIASAFEPAPSPLRAAPAGRRAGPGHDGRRARRPGGGAAAGGHDDAGRLPRLARGGAGLPGRGRGPAGG